MWCHLERYSIIATRFPEKAPELFAYQATIIRSKWNYKAGRWVAYDRLFWRGRTSIGQYWTSNCTMRPSRAEPSCCLDAATASKDDHADQFCPADPNRPWLQQQAIYGQAAPPWALTHRPDHRTKFVASLTKESAATDMQARQGNITCTRAPQGLGRPRSLLCQAQPAWTGCDRNYYV